MKIYQAFLASKEIFVEDEIFYKRRTGEGEEKRV